MLLPYREHGGGHLHEGTSCEDFWTSSHTTWSTFGLRGSVVLLMNCILNILGLNEELNSMFPSNIDGTARLCNLLCDVDSECLDELIELRMYVDTQESN